MVRPPRMSSTQPVARRPSRGKPQDRIAALQDLHVHRPCADRAPKRRQERSPLVGQGDARPAAREIPRSSSSRAPRDGDAKRPGRVARPSRAAAGGGGRRRPQVMRASPEESRSHGLVLPWQVYPVMTPDRPWASSDFASGCCSPCTPDMGPGADRLSSECLKAAREDQRRPCGAEGLRKSAFKRTGGIAARPGDAEGNIA
jgi:hypothetical protein